MRCILQDLLLGHHAEVDALDILVSIIFRRCLVDANDRKNLLRLLVLVLRRLLVQFLVARKRRHSMVLVLLVLLLFDQRLHQLV